MEEVQEIYKIIEYLDDKGKDEWSALLHGFIIYIDENLSAIVSDIGANKIYTKQKNFLNSIVTLLSGLALNRRIPFSK